jgi:hypothetical protein
VNVYVKLVSASGGNIDLQRTASSSRLATPAVGNCGLLVNDARVNDYALLQTINVCTLCCACCLLAAAVFSFFLQIDFVTDRIFIS